MKKVLAVGMLVAAMAAAGCGGSSTPAAPKAEDLQKAKTQVVDQVNKMKADAQQLMEKLDTVKEKAEVTMEKVQTELKKVEQLAKENGVEQKDIDAVKAKLKEAMAKLKKQN